jgi:hypothetical protein
MNAVVKGALYPIKLFVSFISQEPGKTYTKVACMSLSNMASIIGLHSIHVTRFRATPIQPDTAADPDWLKTLHKVADVCAGVSFVLTLATVAPGITVLGALVGRVCTQQQLEAIFGRYACYAEAPRHIFHRCSIAAAVLTIPSVVYTACKWYRATPVNTTEKLNADTMPYYKATTCALAVLIAHRATLHIGSALARGTRA